MNIQAEGVPTGADGRQSSASIAFVKAMAGAIDASAVRRAGSSQDLPGADRHSALVTIAIEMGGALALTIDPAAMSEISTHEFTATLARAFGIGVELGLTVPH